MQGIPLESLEAIRAAGVDSNDPLLVSTESIFNLLKGDLGISISRFPLSLEVLQVAFPGLSDLWVLQRSSVSFLTDWNRRCVEAANTAPSSTVRLFIFVRSFPYFWLGLLLISFWLSGFRYFPDAYLPSFRGGRWILFLCSVDRDTSALTIVISL